MHFIARMLIGFIVGCGLCWLSLAHAQPAIENDRWRVVSIDNGDGGAICAPGLTALLRTGMPADHCASQMSEGARGERVVHFTCAGVGWGRSVFRSLGRGAMRVETQGIKNGQPFAIGYDARTVAACR